MDNFKNVVLSRNFFGYLFVDILIRVYNMFFKSFLEFDVFDIWK